MVRDPPVYVETPGRASARATRYLRAMWFLLSNTVFAQVELCELRSPASVGQQLDLAREALENVDLVRARSELEVSRDAARCLSEPISPELISRIAWLHAEFGLFDQDLDGMFRWVRLAKDAAPDVPPPEHIGIDHPLTRYLPEMPDAPPIEGPEGILVQPKKGGIYMDGERLEVPQARRETPHLVQIFEGKELLDSWWQSGPRFKPEYIAIGEPPPPPVVGPKNWKPEKKNTIESWEAWIAKNTASEWVDEARNRLDQVRFENAEAAGEAGLQAYLADDPGPRKLQARAAIEKIRFDRADAEGTRQAWSIFLAENPRGFYAADAEAKLDELSWKKFSDEDTEEAYARYLTQHKDGAHRDLARDLMVDRAFDRAMESGKEADLRAFRDRFPTSKHIPRVLALLSGTRFDAIQLCIGGEGDLDAVETALREKLDPAGVRVERVDYVDRVRNAQIPAGNGLVWVRVEPSGSGFAAEAAFWAPVGTSALEAWRADGRDAAGLAAAVAKGLPDIGAF